MVACPRNRDWFLGRSKISFCQKRPGLLKVALPLIQRVPRPLSPRTKWRQSETHYSPASKAWTRNDWSCTSIPPVSIHGAHRDIFLDEVRRLYCLLSWAHDLFVPPLMNRDEKRKPSASQFVNRKVDRTQGNFFATIWPHFMDFCERKRTCLGNSVLNLFIRFFVVVSLACFSVPNGTSPHLYDVLLSFHAST